MADPAQGFQSIAAIVRELNWGTVVQVTEPIPFIQLTLDDTFEEHADDVLRGEADRGESSEGNKQYKLTIPCDLTYEDCDLLVAQGMGVAGAPSASGDQYTNTYSLIKNPFDSFTLAVLLRTTVWEYAGCMVESFKITGKANEPVKIDFEIVAKTLSLTSTTNTAAILSALDTTDTLAKIMFSDLEFKMAAQTSALSGTDEIGISSFELDVKNNLALQHDSSSGQNILIPARNGFRDFTFNFEIARYEADTYKNYKINGTDLHAYLKFSSGNYYWDPHLTDFKVIKCDINPDSPGIMPQKVECVLHRDEGSASETYTTEDPIEIDVKNTKAASPLLSTLTVQNGTDDDISDVADLGDYMVVCSALPTTFAEANLTVMLVKHAMTEGTGNGDYTIADTTLTITAQIAVAATNSGTATHIAFIDSVGLVLLGYSTCTAQAVSAGNVVTIPTFDIEEV